MERTVLHCDCNGFYASVECMLRPELKSVPMAVGGDAESRHGIILAKNELAKQYNIVTAETIWQAKKKCPELVIVPPHHEEYAKYSKIVNEIYQEYTDLVEPFGIDESWLDVTASRRLFGDGKTIADELRNRIKKEVGITISVGVSFNKVFAKLGSDYKKPDATTVITKENFQNIVYPLPVSALLFVGGKTLEKLRTMHIFTIGDLAGADREMLRKKLGKAGEMLSIYARGEDDAPVKSVYDKEEVKSVGNGMTFRRDLVGEADIKRGIHILADSVATRMRQKGVKCETVQLQIKSPDFKTVSKQTKLMNPTSLEKEISETAYGLFLSLWSLDKPVRALTITASNLIDETSGTQLTLFSSETGGEKRERLENTIDTLRARFGSDSLRTADILDTDIYRHSKDDETEKKS